MRIRVQDVEDIWSYRRAVYAETPEGMFIAAFDGFGNCLGGSCDEISRVMKLLESGSCREVFRRVVSDWADRFFSERIVEYIYSCKD